MRAAWLICRKDLRSRLRDRSAVLIGIVVPLGLAFIFNAIFSGISGGSNVISLGVVDADHGVASQQFTGQVLEAVGRSGLITIHTEPTVAAANPGAALPPARIRALAAAAAAATAPVAVRDVSAQTRELDQKSFFAAGMAVFFLFFTVQFGVTSLLEERNEGTLARLLAAPVSRASILGGKLLTSFLLGIISMTVLVVATTVLFGAAWGNPFGVAVLIVTAIMAAI